eukprot:TRINITY_DN15852_c0_g1_i1.p1 TRINITY_DN15852_c0_g1~~TRINITY_DN15852_c0_g1_i1.p1  ORF type:complete len:1107 (+),score=234.62 TRINITY_DN15852_c0_g1_i1:41-3322(+)
MDAQIQQMRGVLNFTAPIDVTLFDRVVDVVYSGEHAGTPLHQGAMRVLEEYKTSSEAWSQASTILQNSKLTPAKFISLQTVDDVISKRWNILAEEQRLGVRNFIINMIMDMSGTPEKLVANRMLLEKMNNTLVQILKKDWPAKWPTFIQEIVSSARTSDVLMQNNLAIIRQLSEEIFDFSEGKMTKEHIAVRKQALNNEFSTVFDMIKYVLSCKQEVQLICEALQCLLACLSWIPLGYIFETDLIDLLVGKFLPAGVTRNPACKCLTEIGSLMLDPNDPGTPKYKERNLMLFCSFIERLQQLVPMPPALSYDQVVVAYYQAPSEKNQEFVQNVCQFLISFFKQNISIVEDAGCTDANVRSLFQTAHKYILGITCIDDKEVFKTCVEYWCWVSENVFTFAKPKWDNWGYTFAPGAAGKIDLYSNIFSEARKVLIRNMARPEEVIVFEDENGEIIKEVMKDVDAIALYTTMREALVFLTHLDCGDTETIMVSKIQHIHETSSGGAAFSPSELATLSWAIGSISGAMKKDDENRFLVTVIKDLLTMCEQMHGRAYKASIASDIMYVVGQYPRFLKQHWKFLKTVILKLFSFMQETFEGVQDMAVETFLKMTHSCKEEFVKVHPNEKSTFVQQVLEELETHTRMLGRKQTHIFYEATGLMISEAPSYVQAELVQKFMSGPNTKWKEVIAHISRDSSILANVSFMQDIAHVLKTYVCGAVSVGEGYREQVFLVFNEVMSLYAMYSQLISQEVASKGPMVTRHTHVKCMRIIKKESILLIEEYIKRSSEVSVITSTILPPLLDTVLTDYNKSVEQARDPQVLSLMGALVVKLTNNIEVHVPKILDATLNVTLEMCNKNPQDYPEHRLNFFKLLQMLNKHCFNTFLQALQVSPTIMDAVISAIKHSDAKIEHIGLEMLYDFLVSIANSPIVLDFFQVYFINLVHAVFNVVTDTMHKTGFKYHCKLLQHLINVSVKMSDVQRPIAADQQAGSRADQYFKMHLASQLAVFRTMNQQQIHNFVEGLFSKVADEKAFKDHMRDFLVELHEFSAQDNTDLYDDQVHADKAAKQQQLENRQQIPGIVPQPKARDVMQSRGADEGME